ncbi:MAG TPA: hydrogenase maturation protease [Blastocatellia bacterium]|nr:hydrogenase maturation protease [Blastocatellia bacterium]
MTSPKILIAGIGNIFLADDGFGCAVAGRLARRPLPDGVRVVDFGVRGFDLAYALMDGYDVTILIDAVTRGAEPGALYVIEPDLNELNAPDAQAIMVEAHAMNPMRALALVKSMNGELKRILLVGCEPATLGPEEGRMGLSETVEAAVDGAVEMVESLVAEILGDQRKTGAGANHY